jgi:hypothetical protein
METTFEHLQITSQRLKIQFEIICNVSLVQIEIETEASILIHLKSPPGILQGSPELAGAVPGQPESAEGLEDKRVDLLLLRAPGCFLSQDLLNGSVPKQTVLCE